MRVLMTEDSNNAVSNSFLLDDDSRLDINYIILNLPLPFCALFSKMYFHLSLIALVIGHGAAYHSQLMTSLNQWIRLILQTLNHPHLFEKIQASVSYCHVQTNRPQSEFSHRILQTHVLFV